MSKEDKMKLWDKTLKVNLTAPYRIILGLEELIPDKIGTIINITNLQVGV